MILTIDNLDGKGAVDYTAALDPSSPLTIQRNLNAPSTVGALLNTGTLAVPVRRGRVVIAADNGAVLFTGYIATDPAQEYLGAGLAGPLYRTAFSAVSDEWLLDRQTMPLIALGLAESGGSLLTALTNRVDATLLTTTGVVDGRSVGVFEPEMTQNWSVNAGSIAGSTYAAYRVVDGALSLTPAGSTTHTFSDGDGTLQVAALRTGSVKELANDVTVSGDLEPAVYVTELFEGDGTTTVFELAQTPFIPKRTGNGAYLLDETFQEGRFNPALWSLADPGSHLGFGSNGLRMNGGNGFDGQTTLTFLDSVEMGGTLLIEAGGVQLSAGSDGVLCGLYQGPTSRANCFTGYNVRTSGSSAIVTPFLNGAEVGTSLTVQTGHSYTFRIRLHCPETQRVLQSYYAMVEGAVESFGGGLVASPMSVVFELQDLGLSSNTPATVLYDSAVAGPVPASPASCTFVAVDSVQMLGSMGFCRVSQTGSVWITSTLPSGMAQTRLTGVAGEGVDCELSTTSRITFFSGRIPIPGERIAVTYRSRLQSVARMADPASVAAEAEGGAPGTAAWLGKVVKPAARSTVDCEAAAAAILSFSASRAAALSGTYTIVNPASGDIWPGDVLAFIANDETTFVVVRRVKIESAAAAPEQLTYTVAFANDWAEGLGITLSESISTDALLPATALTAPSQALENLQQLTVVSVTDTAIQVDAGTNPPSGGGFEVRRRDNGFGPNSSQDLVLRTPVRSFSIPRSGSTEQYLVRMYDGSSPPLYSRFSSAILTHIPVD